MQCCTACKAQDYSPCAVYSYPHASKLLRNSAFHTLPKGDLDSLKLHKISLYQNQLIFLQSSIGTSAKMLFKGEKFHFSNIFVRAHKYVCEKV